MEQKKAEVDLLRKEAEVAGLRGKRQQWGITVTTLALLLVAVLGINTYRRYQLTRKTNRLIRREKDRSEDLLLNILPRETAAELREKGAVKARKIDNVTVLFTDFVGFTRHAEKESPELMVRSIDFYFKQFDEITTRYNLEKIKTIGDSYMCAGGLHSEQCQAKEVIKAALEMVAVLEEVKKTREVIPFEMRIGVHTGPVVAGIVGTKKWQYDIWGDTVNIASGMEAKSEAGRVNISQTTYEEVKDDFKTEYRGESKIKNRGVVKMYFVS
jgi:class 3 adenylate cyclase